MRLRRTVIMSVVTAWIFGALCAAAPVQRIHEIQSPLISGPVFVTPGGSFEIKLKLEGKAAAGAELIAAADAAKTAALALGTAAAGPDGLSVVSASVPAEAAEALYDLKVNFSDGTSDTQPHCVKVLKEFKKDFDFVHITDIHFNVDHFEGEGDMNLIRRRLLQDISAQNPEFVVFGGDLGLNPETYDVDYVYGYGEFLNNLTVPMFMVPGNHELYVDDRVNPVIDGLDYWKAAYGPTYRSFDYGVMHVVGINTFDWDAKFRRRFDEEMVFFGTVINAFIGPEQWNWLKGDLETAAGAGKNIVAFTHIPIQTLQGGRKIGYKNPEKMKGPDTEKFTGLLNQFGVSHVFIGHMHYNEEKDFGGLKQVMTQAAGIAGDDSEVFWGYRVVHVKDGKVAGSEIHEIGFKDLK